jgi:asparagine synthase (glutamine-hydrolysing)
VLPLLTRALEDPRVGQSYPNYYAAQLASKFVKVVLSGAGGDELFAGYPWRYYRGVGNGDFEGYADAYYRFWQRLLPTDVVSSAFAPIWADVKDVSTRRIFQGVFDSHSRDIVRPEDCVNLSLYFEAKTFLHGLLLVEDKVSMAHGLEARVPFLDNELVDLAMRIPVRMKLGSLAEVVRFNENEPGPKTARYFERTRDGKLILRRAMTGFVPADVTERVKQGFSAPDASWFQGESIDYVRRRLCTPRGRIYEFLDRATIHSLVDDHVQGRENRRLLIWSLLIFEQWCEEFLDGGA